MTRFTLSDQDRLADLVLALGTGLSVRLVGNYPRPSELAKEGR